MDTVMEGIVVFVFIGLAVLSMLAVLWYLFQTVRIMWAYNSLLAIASVIFSPIVHIIFYFMPKDNFDKHEAGLFKKYFLSIGLVALLGVVAAVVIPATNSSADEIGSFDPDEIETLAYKGDPSAQSHLGAMYYVGRDDVDQDYTKAAEWSQKAADQGNANAQLILGWLYEDGKGVRQDYNEAAGWFRKAADQGNANAQSSLGIMYESGKGVRQDYAEASKLYQKAADQGNGKAQILLGIMYESGKGVRQDYAEAKEWFGKACDNGIQVGCDQYRAYN